MQTTPEPSFEPNDRRSAMSAPIVWRVLVVVSCCAALIAFSLMFVTIRLSGDMASANSYCATPAGHVLQIIRDIQISLLAGCAAVVLSWVCTLFANRSAFGSARWARRTLLVLSTLALVGFACSYAVYYVLSYAGCV